MRWPGPLLVKFTYLYDVFEFIGTVDHFNDQDDPSGDEISLRVEGPVYAALQTLVPGLPGLLRCETYPEGISHPKAEPQMINRVSPYEPWPGNLGLMPYEVKQAAYRFSARDFMYNIRDVAHNDRIRLRGRFIIENGHPGTELVDEDGNNAGYVFFELHPFDYKNILLVPAPGLGRGCSVSTHHCIVPAPLYSAVYSQEIHVGGKTDDHYVYLGDSNGRLFHSSVNLDVHLSAPPLPAELDPVTATIAYVETVYANYTGRPMSDVRSVTVDKDGIRLLVDLNPPLTQQYNGINIADVDDPANEKSVLAATYEVFWQGFGGRLWHTLRDGAGTFSELGDLSAEFAIPGPVRAAAASSVWGGQEDDAIRAHILFVTMDGRLWHTIRNPDGTWTGLGDVSGQLPVPGPVLAVAAASVARDVGRPQDPDEANFMFVTADGKAWHTIRNPDGTWTDLTDMSAELRIPGPVHAIAGAGAPAYRMDFPDAAQFLFTTDDGRLWHTLRNLDGSWSGLGDVSTQFSLPKPIRSVAATGGPGGAHFFLASDGGQLWHTIRYSDINGTWSGLGDVNNQMVNQGDAGIPGFPGGGPPEFVIGEIRSITAATYESVSGSPFSGVEVLFVTDDGHVWNMKRDHSGIWRPLDSVSARFNDLTHIRLAPARCVAASTDGNGNLHVITATDWTDPPMASGA